jgi:hypothetical protein
MSEAFKDVAEKELTLALRAVRQLAAGPRNRLIEQSLRAALDVATRHPFDPAVLVEAIRNATRPAMVLAAEDPGALAIASALGEALNASLIPLASARLEERPPPRRAEPLAAVTRDLPMCAAIVRAPFSAATEAEHIETLDGADALESAVPEADSGDAPPSDEAPRMEREPREDWRPAEAITIEPPVVRLIAPRPTVTVAAFYASIVDQCLDAIAAFARDRSAEPLSFRTDAERRILARTDAILATGGDCIAMILDRWARSLESPHAWGTWAAVFVLGSIEGSDALAAVKAGLLRLGPDAFDHATQAAEALAVSRHPDRAALALDLLTSPHPIARAVGLDLASRGGSLTVDDLRRHLFDGNPAVMIAALVAASRLKAAEAAPLMGLIERWIHFPQADVAWLATRALLRWGNRSPYDEARSGGALVSMLRARALEIFVLAGSKSDLASIERLAGRAARTPTLLSALARFGHPGVGPFLLHHLADDDLGEAAASALVTLFGALVEPDELGNQAAWRAAITRAKPDAGVRLRRGQPWSPMLVAAECTSGELSRRDIALRIDELETRLRVETPVDLALWTIEVQLSLAAFSAAAGRCGSSPSDHGWS